MLREQCIKHINSNINGVIKITEQQRTYWLKIGGEDKSNFICKLSSVAGQFNLLSCFQSKATMNSWSRFEHEKSVLLYLNSIGFQVPKIALEGKRFFVTPDKGQPLSQVEAERITDDILMQLFNLFIKLHNADIAHGRPALRDILIDRHNQLSLIDFEESIMHASPKLKARDIYLLLMDLCRIKQVTIEQKRKALCYWKRQVSDEYWQSLIGIHQLLRKFKPLAHGVLYFKKNNKLSQQLIETCHLFDTFL
ncbi:serine/threonine protein kinase [Vibrio spartinae]|uniref:Serine/threonine protein kinase n=2 Tax=Vibrio spartinae TaxID=1918945 RepID=A0ABX6QWV0_9VIBR|nr:serine/threonine protein kinase [Vibrio spartinae]